MFKQCLAKPHHFVVCRKQRIRVVCTAALTGRPPLDHFICNGNGWSPTEVGQKHGGESATKLTLSSPIAGLPVIEVNVFRSIYVASNTGYGLLEE